MTLNSAFEMSGKRKQREDGKRTKSQHQNRKTNPNYKISYFGCTTFIWFGSRDHNECMQYGSDAAGIPIPTPIINLVAVEMN